MVEGQEKYKRCLVLAGGGGRLGTHLGTYAAACEAGEAPDLLLGTCGGALVAELGLPTVVIQEGGYDVSALGANVQSWLAGLGAGMGLTGF